MRYQKKKNNKLNSNNCQESNDNMTKFQVVNKKQVKIDNKTLFSN